MRLSEFALPSLGNNFKIDVPDGRTGPAVADVQKALLALGFPLPVHGVDGIRGPETSEAVKQFQNSADLTVDGDPGVETVAALNAAMSEKGITFPKSTAADVKTAQGGIIGAQSAVSNPVKPADVASYLRSKGLDNNQTLGIMANIKAESNFNSGAIGDNGTSGGLFQHHADRFAGMVNAAGGEENWQQNWQKQIDFALSEPAGEKYVRIGFSTPEQATAWWTRNFEKPANVDQQVASRINNLSTFA